MSLEYYCLIRAHQLKQLHPYELDYKQKCKSQENTFTLIEINWSFWLTFHEDKFIKILILASFGDFFLKKIDITMINYINDNNMRIEHKIIKRIYLSFPKRDKKTKINNRIYYDFFYIFTRY